MEYGRQKPKKKKRREASRPLMGGSSSPPGPQKSPVNVPYHLQPRRLLDLRVAREVLLLDPGRDLLEHVLREETEQLPRNVQGGEDVALLVGALRQEAALELVDELEVEVVVLVEGLLADHRLHGARVHADGVVRVELVRDARVVVTRHALADTSLHQTAQRRQHVDRRVHLAVVETTVHEHLALSDVARKVRDRMRDVVVGHRQDRELRDRTVLALDTAGALINRRQVSVHVTRVTTATRHLLTGGRHLTKGISVGRHVRENAEHVLLERVREVLSRRQGKARRHDTLDSRIVRQVQVQHDVLHGPVLLEVVAEEARGLHVHAHGAEDNGEVVHVVIRDVLALHQGRLACDLGGDLVVRQTGGGEERKLLTAHNTVHGVKG